MSSLRFSHNILYSEAAEDVGFQENPGQLSGRRQEGNLPRRFFPDVASLPGDILQRMFLSC